MSFEEMGNGSVSDRDWASGDVLSGVEAGVAVEGDSGEGAWSVPASPLMDAPQNGQWVASSSSTDC